MSGLQRVEITFEGEELASFTSEWGTTYRLFRSYESEEPSLFVHWQDEDGAWLEYGPLAQGLTRAQVARLWPELVENLD